MKKKIALGAATVATLVASVALPTAAIAQPLRSSATTTATEGSALVDARGTRTTEHPGGGTWDYGVRGFLIKDTYSRYLHPTKKHGSSVENGNGDFKRSATVGPKAWSDVTVHHTFVGNKAWWRVE